MGSREFINDIKRFCIWINDLDFQEAVKNLKLKKE